jgi:3-phosphoshikimate 1-carboxyvinyltransferase
MNVHIERSEPSGKVAVPGSKSYSIRAAVCASIAHGESAIEDVLVADDTGAAFECLEVLGASVSRQPGVVQVRGGDLHPADSLQCRESGAAFRFLLALAATIPGRTVLHCAPSLARRPVAPLLDSLRQPGVQCEFDAADGTAVVSGRRLTSGSVTLRGDTSSQFLSALLLSGPRCRDGLSIELSTPLVSRRYVSMTLACMREFGVGVRVSADGRSYATPGGDYHATRYRVEGDWSAASALLALGALAGEVTVTNLAPASLQADAAMLTLLRGMGAEVAVDGKSVTVRKSALRAVTFDLSECIDLLPAAAALAARAGGMTTLTGIGRAREKESDRVAAMLDGLRRLGIQAEAGEDEMHVRGGAGHGAVVSSAGDHRIAMAFCALGTAVGDVTIENAGCVAKTYPGFWRDVELLGVRVQSDEQ